MHQTDNAGGVTICGKFVEFEPAPKYSTSVDESQGARCRHDMNEVRKSLVSVVVRDG